MKEAFVIIRFGDNEALPEDIAAITAICGEDNMDGQMGMPLPVGIMSLVYTESTVKDISNIYNILMHETEQVLPFMIFKLYYTSYLSYIIDMCSTYPFGSFDRSAVNL